MYQNVVIFLVLDYSLFFILFNTNLNTTMPASNSFSWFSNVNQPFSLLDFTSLASSFISCSVAYLFLKSCILGITCLLCSFRFNVRHRIQRLSAIIIKTLFNFPNHSHCICNINIICFNIYIISRTTHCFFCTCECKILYRF